MIVRVLMGLDVGLSPSDFLRCSMLLDTGRHVEGISPSVISGARFIIGDSVRMIPKALPYILWLLAAE